MYKQTDLLYSNNNKYTIFAYFNNLIFCYELFLQFTLSIFNFQVTKLIEFY